MVFLKKLKNINEIRVLKSSKTETYSKVWSTHKSQLSVKKVIDAVAKDTSLCVCWRGDTQHVVVITRREDTG